MPTVALSDSTYIIAAAALSIGVVIGFAIGRVRAVSKENRGEAAVRRRLTLAFKGYGYHLLNNVTMPYQDGTTQIDHVLVARSGVFVIESKHFTGWIFGDSTSPM